MSEHLKIYNAVRAVPPEAQKSIGGGRLKGMTDINPMWRIKTLTEQFGPCGIGWYPEITKQWIEEGAKEEKTAYVNINLYVKYGGEWSKPIPGTGGSMFVESESRGLHTSDECFKMAYTDAISVACKCLGFGADIYWDKDKTKYDRPVETQNNASQPTTPKPNENAAKGQETPNTATETPAVISAAQASRLYAIAGGKGKKKEVVIAEVKKNLGIEPEAMDKVQYSKIIKHYESLPDAAK